MAAGEGPMDDETASDALAGVREATLVVEELRRLLAAALAAQRRAAAPCRPTPARPESSEDVALDVGP